MQTRDLVWNSKHLRTFSFGVETIVAKSEKQSCDKSKRVNNSKRHRRGSTSLLQWPHDSAMSSSWRPSSSAGWFVSGRQVNQTSHLSEWRGSKWCAHGPLFPVPMCVPCWACFGGELLCMTSYRRVCCRYSGLLTPPLFADGPTTDRHFLLQRIVMVTTIGLFISSRAK